MTVRIFEIILYRQSPDIAPRVQATLFRPAIGACGAVRVDSDSVVALSPSQYANGAHCLQHILVHGEYQAIYSIYGWIIQPSHSKWQDS